jgi:hypothetical protein
MKEVTEIIEIVFEDLQLERLVTYLIKAQSNSTLKDLSISTDQSEINLESEEKLLESFNVSSNGSFYFNFLNYSFKDIQLSRVGFQIIKFENKYDLILSIEENEMRKKLSILDFQNRVISLAKEMEATNYYCGYEPAFDEETRLFTGVLLGPLKGW